ncbi:7143_t:CDS:2 [Diversispora eburnea]|uniref:7143_t:CDS:1 n=1 Tax=Diversispora eburnea TaxID=1213867 RepID=A0A9N8V008_9GLOM|nr:7143_t:CDS:2 [Diversispora eburnea]
MFGCGYIIAWLTVPSIYTAFTVHEIGNIPFVCPNSYNYSLPSLQITCQIRAINLTLIWVFSTFLVFSVILFIVSEDDNDIGYRDDTGNIDEIPLAVATVVEDVTSGNNDIDNLNTS